LNSNLQLDLDIYPIWYSPFWKSYAFSISAAALGLIIVAVILFKNKKEVPKKAMQKKSILQMLEELELPKVNSRQEKNKFYIALISISKRMFKDYSFVDLEGRTERELLEFLSNEYKPFADKLKIVIDNAVQVKYSNDDFYTQMSLDKNLLISIAEELEGDYEV
jgi:hypothetical protein